MSWINEFFGGFFSSGPTTSGVEFDKFIAEGQMQQPRDFGNDILKSLGMPPMKFIEEVGPRWNSTRQRLEYEEQVLGVKHFLRRSS